MTDMTADQAAAALDQILRSVDPAALATVAVAAALPPEEADQAIVDLLNSAAAGTADAPTFAAVALAARLAFNVAHAVAGAPDPEELAAAAHQAAASAVPDTRPVSLDVFRRVTGADPSLPADENDEFETVRHAVVLAAATLPDADARARFTVAYHDQARRLAAGAEAAQAQKATPEG